LKRKCDMCDKPATHHCVEIVGGKKIEKHLCDEHAIEQGLAGSAAHLPINELLTNFVKLHSGMVEQQTADTGDPTCEQCGMTFTQFRDKSLLGCPACYSAFEGPLTPLLERAHEGGTHHIGKTPRRGGAGIERQVQLTRLRKRLDDAVASEDYELAARLRDDIHGIEEHV